MTSRFSPDGSIIASGGADKQLFLWNTPLTNIFHSNEKNTSSNNDNTGNIPVNYARLSGHKSAITSLRWSSDGETIATASADKTVGLWDIATGKRLRKFQGHELTVNEVTWLPSDYQIPSNSHASGGDLLASVADDGYVCIWDTRSKSYVADIKTDYPLLTVVSGNSNSVSGGSLIYTSGIDPTVHAYDLRNSSEPYYQIETPHSDAVTSLAINNNRDNNTNDNNYNNNSNGDGDDSSILISQSMDGTVRAYDASTNLSRDAQRVQPALFNIAEQEDGTTTNATAANDEKLLIRAQLKQFGGSNKKKKQNLIFAGSADKSVAVWDFETQKLLGKLYGHRGTVVDVDLHPVENVVLSCSTDGTLIVREV